LKSSSCLSGHSPCLPSECLSSSGLVPGSISSSQSLHSSSLSSTECLSIAFLVSQSLSRSSDTSLVSSDCLSSTPLSRNSTIDSTLNTVLLYSIPPSSDKIDDLSGSVSVPETLSSHTSHSINLHDRVFATGLPNFRQARLPVPSRLMLSAWRYYLKDYSDTLLCDFLEFGWPVGYNYCTNHFPVSDVRNHKVALFP